MVHPALQIGLEATQTWANMEIKIQLDFAPWEKFNASHSQVAQQIS